MPSNEPPAVEDELAAVAKFIDSTGVYAQRNERLFMEHMNALCRLHLNGCNLYKAIWNDWKVAHVAEELPYLHAGLFKQLDFRRTGATFGRVLHSSSTSQNKPSQIALDNASSKLQAKSSLAILTEFVGSEKRPLLIFDDDSLVRRSQSVSARFAAAMSLFPLASDVRFIVRDASDMKSVKWEFVAELLKSNDRILAFGMTWALWQAMSRGNVPEFIKDLLTHKEVCFAHSGGWKKLEAEKVNRTEFNEVILEHVSPESKVIDFYGLVEQVGVVFPLCEQGNRHVPRWADFVVRDLFTMQPTKAGEVGAIQLINPLAFGAPYHSVLTEDLAIDKGAGCICRRKGRIFELIGRIPNAEVRGCANV